MGAAKSDAAISWLRVSESWNLDRSLLLPVLMTEEVTSEGVSSLSLSTTPVESSRSIESGTEYCDSGEEADAAEAGEGWESGEFGEFGESGAKGSTGEFRNSEVGAEYR